MRGATCAKAEIGLLYCVSIHAPRAGRDRRFIRWWIRSHRFNPRAPCGARRGGGAHGVCYAPFQSTRPVRGATRWRGGHAQCDGVSIHAPRAGRDVSSAGLTPSPTCFNPRAPCGARPCPCTDGDILGGFQSTRPVRGATASGAGSGRHQEFQSTRPVRGATICILGCLNANTFQSTRPVRGATSGLFSWKNPLNVSIHAPRAGRDPRQFFSMLSRGSFNPRAPCGARRQKRSRLPSFATYSWVLLAMNTVCLAHTSHTPPLMWFTHLYFFTSFSVYFTFALLKVLR